MKKFLIILSALVSITLTAFYLNNNKKTASETKQNNSPTALPTQSEIDNLGLGGSSYLDKSGVYSFLYPNEYILDESDSKNVRIYKKGEMQRPQSEMSDGVILVFETPELNNNSLENEVEKRIQNSQTDGVSKIIEPKKATRLNGYPGFTFKVEGLGEFKFLALQKDRASKKAVIITILVNDPQQKGYQKEVDAILSTLKILQ